MIGARHERARELPDVGRRRPSAESRYADYRRGLATTALRYRSGRPLQTTWVLRDVYDPPKTDLVATLDRILATQQFEILDKDRVREAVEQYRIGRADFADHLGAVNRQAPGQALRACRR